MTDEIKKPDMGSQANRGILLCDKQILIEFLHKYETEVKGPKDILPFVERMLGKGAP